jgi:bifunctional non-homologous end joining protein LigD
LACLKSNPNPFASLLASSCLASLRSPTGPGWLHEAKWNGYRVIARKDGERVRLWARMTSDYSNAFARIRNAVAALPVETAVLDREAILLSPDNTYIQL